MGRFTGEFAKRIGSVGMYTRKLGFQGFGLLAACGALLVFSLPQTATTSALELSVGGCCYTVCEPFTGNCSLNTYENGGNMGCTGTVSMVGCGVSSVSGVEPVSSSEKCQGSLDCQALGGTMLIDCNAS